MSTGKHSQAHKSDENSKKESDQQKAGSNPIGTENTSVGGNLAENNDRGSGARAPQGPGTVNEGTDIPAQGIDNHNKEAQEQLRTQGGENRTAEGIAKLGADDTTGKLEGGNSNQPQPETTTTNTEAGQRSAFDGGKTQEEIEGSKGNTSLMQEAQNLGQKPAPASVKEGQGPDTESLAEKRIRPGYNRSGHGKVTAVKGQGVDLFKEIESIPGVNSEVARYKSMALTNLELAISQAEMAIEAGM